MFPGYVKHIETSENTNVKGVILGLFSRTEKGASIRFFSFLLIDYLYRGLRRIGNITAI